HPNSPLFPYTTLFRSHFRSQHVDARDNARLFQIEGELIERLPGLELGLRRVHEGRGGQRLRVGIGGDQHDEVPCVLELESSGLEDRKSTRLNSSHRTI